MKLRIGIGRGRNRSRLDFAAYADDSDKFVVRGDATKVLMEQNEINVATAEAISKACVDEANKQGVKVSIAIYDQFGEPVYMYRMDGQAKDRHRDRDDEGAHRAQYPPAQQGGHEPGADGPRHPSCANIRSAISPIPAVCRSSSTATRSSAQSASAARHPICRPGATKSAPGARMTKVIGPQPALLPDVQPNASSASGR